MSYALYPSGQLRFWTEHEIETREWFILQNLRAVQEALWGINKAWFFLRTEGPLLTPYSHINPAYGPDDVWWTQGHISDEKAVLRPETTASSYLYAKDRMKNGFRAPLCVWQAGKSFRRETNDGASASKLRFFEFWQQEFQCIYHSEKTKADYRPMIEAVVKSAIENATRENCRVVPSDRLPQYSEMTNDIEAFYNGRWTEMASISTRLDFDADHKVLEVAIGLDRLVCTRFDVK